MTTKDKLKLKDQIDARNDARARSYYGGPKSPEQKAAEKAIVYHLRRAIEEAKRYCPDIRYLSLAVTSANSKSPRLTINNEYMDHDRAHPLNYSSLIDEY